MTNCNHVNLSININYCFVFSMRDFNYEIKNSTILSDFIHNYSTTVKAQYRQLCKLIEPGYVSFT